MDRRKLTAVITLVFSLTSFSWAYGATAAQKFTFKLDGDCADNSTSGTFEEDVTSFCQIVVTINPAKPFRTVNLQYKDDSGSWQFANDNNNEKISIKSNSSKRVVIEVPYYDEDGVFFDFEQRIYRVYMGKIGAAPGVASKPITINYVQAGGAGDEVETES